MPTLRLNGQKIGGTADYATNINYNNTNSNLNATNVQDAIDEVNSSLTDLNIQNITCHYCYGGIIYYAKIGNVCMFYTGSVVLPLGSTQISTIPEGFRPVIEIATNFTAPQSTDTVQICLKPTGEVYAYNYTNNATKTINIRPLLTYLVK